MFKSAKGDLLGLPTNDRHINVEWDRPERILFSMTQRGDSLSCHFAADPKALRYIKQAINEFCRWAFSLFRWCKMIIAVIEKPSVERIVKKCSFFKIGTIDDKAIYARVR